ncbi:trace amine-associated receptor 13c-like [Takifugu flavidus]|uniref:trace amine-associated receptor 13c-like n=1 Tax=Takifugu flavidus TaxID=433684 RepID=UPI002544918B|nr:trace amine-associated receptor 13c-like [Takifugu flavidus]
MSLEDGDGYISPFNTSCRLMSDAWKSTLISAALVCLAPLTVVLNLVVVVSISHFRHFQTTTNIILLSMAVSDLLVGLAVMPLMIVTLDFCWCISSFICFLFDLLSFVLTSASVGNMVLISVDRYVAICYPLRYSSIKPSTVKICVSVCWISSIIYNLILLKDNLLNIDSSSCYKKCPFSLNDILAIVDVFITFYVPLTVIIVLYTRVFVVAVTQARAMRSQVSTTGSKTVSAMKSELRAARTLGIVILFFFIVFFPYFISSIIGQDTSNEASTGQLLLFFSNSTINPIIYAFFYPWFRKTVKLLLSCKFCKL